MSVCGAWRVRYYCDHAVLPSLTIITRPHGHPHADKLCNWWFSQERRTFDRYQHAGLGLMVKVSGSKGQIVRNLDLWKIYQWVTGKKRGNLTFRNNSPEMGGGLSLWWDMWALGECYKDRESGVWWCDGVVSLCVLFLRISVAVDQWSRVTLNASLQFSDLVWSC